MAKPLFLHVDTTSAPFEDVEGDPGSKRQLLQQHEDSGGVVEIVYVPPGFSSNVADVLREGVHRHYHRSVNERHYVLSGDYPVWHWPDVTADGELTILRRHSYLENPPLTVHGVKPEARPETGTQLLVWNNGPGTSIFEPEAACETITLPNDLAKLDMVAASPRIVLAEEIPWLDHPASNGWKLKPIAPAAPQSPPVCLVHIPADWRGDVTSIEGRDRQWLFLLSGDLSVDVSTSQGSHPICLKEGHFLAWSGDAKLTLSKKLCSYGSCTVLCVGHDLAKALADTASL